MRLRTLTVVSGAVLLTACAPYRIDHRHLVLDETPGLVVLERSTTAVDSQGEPLKSGKVGFPTEVVLKRERYDVLIELSPSSVPMLFLSARTAQGTVLNVEGAHVRRVHPDAEVLGYQFGFMVEEADGEPLEFVVRAADGTELGRERLTYKIRSRGVAYGIEWI
ncbi:MAG TPA: hypothetical protein VIV63_05235 [Steroidobacteraceae bacterium]